MCVGEELDSWGIAATPFAGAVLELAAETGAFLFFDVPRVTCLTGEGALGREATSLLVVDDEVRDWVCFGGGD